MGLYLWQGYFLKELIKRFFIVITLLYVLYITIDSVSQVGNWRQQQMQLPWFAWMRHYLYEFLYRADVLLPFALLLATLHTLLSLQNHGELIALRCSGISLKKIMRLFLSPAVILASLLYINAEYGLPAASRELQSWQRSKRGGNAMSQGVQELALADGSRLLFRDYNEGLFTDVFWVQNGDSILRMRHLTTSETPPKASFVEELKRSEKGLLELVSVAEERLLPTLPWQNAAIHPEQESLRKLWSQLPSNLQSSYSYRQAQLVTIFWLRMILPWLALLSLAIAGPYCLIEGRRSSSLAIYTGAIFGLVTFYLFLDAAAILSKRQIIDPLWALFPPLAIASTWSCYNYCRLR